MLRLSTLKVYPNGLITGVQAFKNQKDKLLLTNNEKVKQVVKSSLNESLERSQRRRRSRIQDYVLCNEFNWFCTLTFAEQSKDKEKVRLQISNWVKNLRKRQLKNKDFHYIIIMEQHKSGAWHCHALFNQAVSDHMVFAKNRYSTATKKQHESFNLGLWQFGFSTCEKILDRNRVASYIMKYITKELFFEKGRQSYFCSQGLALPEIYTGVDVPVAMFHEVHVSNYFNYYKLDPSVDSETHQELIKIYIEKIEKNYLTYL